MGACTMRLAKCPKCSSPVFYRFPWPLDTKDDASCFHACMTCGYVNRKEAAACGYPLTESPDMDRSSSPSEAPASRHLNELDRLAGFEPATSKVITLGALTGLS